MSKFKYSTGTRIRGFVLIGYQGKGKWSCKCDCGVEFIITSKSFKIQQGCKWCSYKRKRIHGGSGTPEYQAWRHLLQRCYDPNDRGYKSYGGRGIKVCDRWKESFSAFLEDVGKRPSAIYSLDRIRVNEDYEPSNCKWSTRKEQNWNKSNNIYLEYDNKRMNIVEWAAHTGLSYTSIYQRLRNKWPIEDIINTPLKTKRHSHEQIH